MNSQTSGTFTIIYQKTMSSTNYKSLVSIILLNIDVGFVDNYDAANGIHLWHSCASDKTQTSMKCNITAINKNINSIVYLTYVVSDHGSLFVGSF